MPLSMITCMLNALVVRQLPVLTQPIFVDCVFNPANITFRLPCRVARLLILQNATPHCGARKPWSLARCQYHISLTP